MRRSRRLLLAIVGLGLIAGVATSYVLRDPDVEVPTIVIASEPIDLVPVTRSAREPAAPPPPPLPRTIDFHYDAGSRWRPAWADVDGGPLISGNYRDIHVDLVKGWIYSEAFDGGHNQQLTDEQIAALHRLTAASCRQRWDHDPHCYGGK